MYTFVWLGPLSARVPAPSVPIVPAVSAARQLAVPLRAALIRSPVLPLGAVAVATFVWFAASNGGFDATTWYPGALVVLALAGIAAVTIPATGVPPGVSVAAGGPPPLAPRGHLSVGLGGPKG